MNIEQIIDIYADRNNWTNTTVLILLRNMLDEWIGEGTIVTEDVESYLEKRSRI